jgi:hypothetical protein
MPANEGGSALALSLDADERAELLRILERELKDTHVEARRTESPDFQDAVHHREHILQGLIKKLRAS